VVTADDGETIVWLRRSADPQDARVVDMPRRPRGEPVGEKGCPAADGRSQEGGEVQSGMIGSPGFVELQRVAI
jgi:hypothetical protein